MNSGKLLLLFILIGGTVGGTSIVSAQEEPPSLPSSFNFYGYTYDLNLNPLNGTNVTIEVYEFLPGQPPQINSTYSTLSNESGFFNISDIPVSEEFFYKPVVRYFNGSNLTYMGQSLPQLPIFEFLNLGAVKFYLREAATLNITAVGDERELESMIVGTSNSVSNYGVGLEWLQDVNGGTWFYLNLSGYGIEYSSDFSSFVTTSQPIPLQNPTALDYNGGNIFYIANATTVIVYNRTSESVLASYNVSGRNYYQLAGLQYNPDDGMFYISATRTAPPNVVIDVYNSSFDLINTISGNIPSGTLFRYAGEWYLAYNDTYEGVYALTKYDDNWGYLWRWTFSKSVGGIAHNGMSWYFASSNDSTITPITLTDKGIKSFMYMVKDTKLGYPVAESFSSFVQQATVYVPADRNYSIMLYPNMAMPVSYDLNNISAYGPSPKIDITFNISEDFKWVSGYVNCGGSYSFDDLKVVPYLLEPGNMVFPRAMPYNMSAWREPFASQSDEYSPSIGFYNITLIGSAMGADVMLFITAKNGTQYCGGFQNVTLYYGGGDLTGINITLQPLIGSESNISVENAADFSQTVNITTKLKSFRLQNSTGDAPTNAFVEFTIDYTSYFPNSTSFSWMVDVGQDDNGIFKLPVLSANVKEINIYSAEFAPKETSLKASDLATEPVNITLSSFSPGAIDPEEIFTDLYLDLLQSNSTCDVPNPPPGCSLVPSQEEMLLEQFNPMTVIMGGGDISFRMKKLSNNITVHYALVDLLASGPPDALFDSNASETTTGATLAEAWRFGSSGPDIYDHVLIGIPYNESKYDESGNFTVNIKYFYDADWNVIWNISENTTEELPDEYSEFLQDEYRQYLNLTNPMPCDKTDQTSTCYVDTVNNMVWMKIPHFSGVAPLVSGEAVDSTPPSVIPHSVSYPSGQTFAKPSDTITLNATVTDDLSGVKNVTVDASDINAGVIILQNLTSMYYNDSVVIGSNVDSGVYQLPIYAYDNDGNLNSTERITVMIDSDNPSLTVYTPTDSYISTSPNVTFTFLASDNNATTLQYELTLNGTVNKTGTITAGELNSVTIYNLADGYYTWSIRVYDGANNTNTSTTQAFTVLTEIELQVPIASMPANYSTELVTNETPIGKVAYSITTNGTTPAVNLTIKVSISPVGGAESLSSSTDIPELYIQFSISNESWYSYISHVHVRLYYNESKIPSGVSESSLRPKRYTSGSWVRLTGAATLADGTVVYAAGVDADNNYVWANISRFSVYGVGGTIVQAAAPSGGGRYKPDVVVLANSIDAELSADFLGFLKTQALNVIYVDASNFSKYKDKKFIVILGGPDAYEGVGEIVQEVLDDAEEAFLRIPGNRKMYVKTNVWATGQVVRVIAGSGRTLTRDEALENQADVAYRIRFYPVS